MQEVLFGTDRTTTLLYIKRHPLVVKPNALIRAFIFSTIILALGIFLFIIASSIINGKVGA